MGIEKLWVIGRVFDFILTAYRDRFIQCPVQIFLETPVFNQLRLYKRLSGIKLWLGSSFSLKFHLATSAFFLAKKSIKRYHSL